MYCGVGAVKIQDRIGKIIGKLIINNVDLISLRDEDSKLYLQELKIKKPPIHVTSDLAFLLKKNNKTIKFLEEYDSFLKIGVNLRSFDQLYSFYSSETLNNKKLAEILDNIIEEYNSKIIFLPMITKKRASFYHQYLETDEEIMEKIISLMKNKKNTIIIKEEYMPEETLNILENMDLIISMRLHVLILASIVEVPTIAINYAPKIKSLGLTEEKYLLNLDSLNKSEIIKLINKRLNSKSNLNTTNLKTKAEKNGDYILKLLNQNKKNLFKFYINLIPATIMVLLINYGLKIIEIISLYRTNN